ncbi:Carboxy-terminal domain RNA polymerase II polypeptide A small phosphatase 2 [Galdieria sulphuraria]|uniref:Phosphatase n=1 Tax=Galdieria sulphuraria TaxID=130081 RepID=M2Y0Z4_GALSU|nr:phosphatase [Galdieria sulphuraria]EME29598.1 phosphatase [Galdieria sulphuraria]GJD12807.1 Carboxy-terminal domain RNA polymerase II polypeptide A small phosphatase 2 [Galdieria sulphuraria]|eukprot:XP_005706118.1 phosphatase [Galdieria sulphuraria]
MEADESSGVVGSGTRTCSNEQSFDSRESIERLLLDLPGPDEGFLLATLEASTKSLRRPSGLQSLDFSRLKTDEDEEIEEEVVNPKLLDDKCDAERVEENEGKKEEASRTSDVSSHSESSSRRRRRRRSRSFLNSPRAGGTSVNLARDLELLHVAQEESVNQPAYNSSHNIVNSILKLFCLVSCTAPSELNDPNNIGGKATNNSGRSPYSDMRRDHESLKLSSKRGSQNNTEDAQAIKISIKKHLIASSVDKDDDNTGKLEKGLTRLASLPLLKRRSSTLLPIQSERMKGRKTLVLDLDETLVHSSFDDSKHESDFTLNLDISNISMTLFVKKRPWCDEFLQKVSQIFEIIIFTASLPAYADPVIDMLCDSANIEPLPSSHRLFRDSCEYDTVQSGYVKKLSSLGRDLSKTIIVDNSPAAYVYNIDNAIPIESFVDDMNDNELLNILPWLLSLNVADDVREKIRQRREFLKQPGIGRKNGQVQKL